MQAVCSGLEIIARHPDELLVQSVHARYLGLVKLELQALSSKTKTCKRIISAK